MSQLHLFVCDVCNKKVQGSYNGEHHIHPVGWKQLYCDIKSRAEQFHMCPQCIPTKKGMKKK